jgi:hypothetical protein
MIGSGVRDSVSLLGHCDWYRVRRGGLCKVQAVFEYEDWKAESAEVEFEVRPWRLAGPSP